MKKGFTLVELLAVIVILAVISLVITPLITGVISNSKKKSFENSTSNLITVAEQGYHTTIIDETATETTYTYTNGAQSLESGNININYNGKKPQNGTMIISSNGDIALAVHDGKWCASKWYTDDKVTVSEKTLSQCKIPVPQYVDTSGANAPVLATGMTAVRWDGTNWVEAENINDLYKQNWYDYEDKNWANAKTADGSMWVWVPRYVYRITTGWHSNTTGTIEAQFSHGTNDNWNTDITLNTGTGADASNNSWTNHPGFNFGGTELTGIWVAKFKASVANQSDLCYTTPNSTNCNVATLSPKIIPNAISWRYIKIGTMFTVARNMETNAIYGWGTTGSGIDTHLMKNTEWGITVYLSKSQYGKNAEEIHVNNSDNYTTGCDGVSPMSAASGACQNAYNTAIGFKGSSTGTIYGIYDLSGNANELVAAYINNNNANLANNGSSIVSADNKYKDIYTKGSTDDAATNYGLTSNFKGDAIYEISSNSGGNNAWFGDSALMAFSSNPWISRSGMAAMGSSSGAYYFGVATGGAIANSAFRPVLVVDASL